MYRRLYAFYCDFSYYFFNKELREYLRGEEVVIDYRSFEAFKSIKIIKVYNRLLEDVLWKDSQTHLKWDQRISKLANYINTRIITHLGFSPIFILFNDLSKTLATTTILLALSKRDIYT